MSIAVPAHRATLWLGLRCVVTIGVLAALWRAAGGTEIVERLLQVSPIWLAAAVAALILQTTLSAQRWRLTAAQLGQSLPNGYATREYFLSQAVNQAVPGAVVGDAARAVRARDQAGLRIAAQAVIFERVAGQIAMFLTLAIAFVATVIVAGGVEWPPAMQAAIAVAVAGGAASLAAIGVFIAVPDTRVSGWLRPLARALFHSDILPAQALLGLAITACNLAAFGFAARSVGVELTVIEIVALVPVILFAMLVPLTVSGWGVREGAAAFVLPIAGVSAADGVAASILFGLALLISVLPGAVLVLSR